MFISPSKYYKDLMIEFITMALGGMIVFPQFENYHPEYLKEYSIEDLEKTVKKFSKKGNTYYSFMAGMTFSNCMETWEKENKKLSDEQNDEFIDASQAGLTSFMTLLGIEDISDEELLEMFDPDECDCECDCECEDCDCEEDDCNCCDKHCGNCDCGSCSDCIDEDDLLEEE